MNPRRRLIAVVAALAVVNLLFFFFFIGSRRSELNDVKDDVETAENEAVQLRARLARLEELQEDAPRLEAELSEVRSFVPNDDDVASFIFQVQEAADEAGVAFVQVTPQVPKPPPEGGELAQVSVVIGARGGYFSLQDLVRRLYELDRAMRIDRLSLTVDEAIEGRVDEVLLNLTARIFFEPPSGVAATGTTAPPVEAEPSPSPSPSPEQ